MYRVFISHSHSDTELVTQFRNLLLQCDKKMKIFCSSFPESGVGTNEDWKKSVSYNLKKADSIFFLVTPNFFRSHICLMEYGAVCFSSEQKIRTSKNIAVIVFPGVDQYDLSRTFGNSVYIDSTKSTERARLSNILAKIAPLHTPAIETATKEFFTEAILSSKPTPPIGAYNEFKNINSICDTAGIRQITYGSCNRAVMEEKIRNAAEIRVIATTACTWIHTFANSEGSSPLFDALKNGAALRVLFGNPGSALLNDIDRLEKRTENALTQEAQRTFHSLNILATKLHEAGVAASIECGCVGTLLRQTAIIITDKNQNSWAWLTITLPPHRCAAKSMSMELLPAGESSMLVDCIKHFEAIWEDAHQRNMLRKIVANDEPQLCFELVGSIASDYWRETEQKTIAAMQHKAYQTEQKVLIEIAAQHPLENGKPGIEFQARLDEGIALYHEFNKNGKQAVIYVPGSIHQVRSGGKVIADSVSLSKAGSLYLLEHGIPQSAIRGDEQNHLFMGEDGVYCSADECRVAYAIFDEEQCTSLYCVCSPQQVLRKSLFYMHLGVMPSIVSVPTVIPSHGFAGEALDCIPQILRNPEFEMDPRSERGKSYRKSRRPDPAQ